MASHVDKLTNSLNPFSALWTKRPNRFWQTAVACALCLGVNPSWGNSTPWPFDQRQIALVQTEGGSFPNSVDTAEIMDAFVRLGRVRWVTQKGGAGQIVPLTVPKDFPWQSAPAVRSLGLKLKADGLVHLSMRGVQLDLRWYSSLDGEPLFFESVTLPDAGEKQENKTARQQRLDDWLADLWSKIPGDGYVVRRDLSTVTLEGAKQQKLTAGTRLELRRLEKMERHPLLKTLVRIPSQLTGRATIERVEESFAVAKIDYESSLDPINPGDRYVVLEAEPKTQVAADANAKETPTTTEPPVETTTDGRKFVPLFGKDETPTTTTEDSELPGKAPEYNMAEIRAALSFGRQSHTDELSGGTTRDLSGYAPGVRLNGTLYVTPDIQVYLAADYSFLSFSGTDYGASKITSGLTRYRFGGAYRFQFSSMSDSGTADSDLVLLLGANNTKFPMALVSASDAPTEKTFKGYELGIQLKLPLVKRLKVQVEGAKVFRSQLVESSPTAGASPSPLSWYFGASVIHPISKSTNIIYGLDFTKASVNYSESGTRTTPSISTQLGNVSGYVGLGYTI